MVYCNPKDILDAALNKVQDNSTDLRTKALGWLNEVVLDIAAQPRKWTFLETLTSIIPSEIILSLPGGGSNTLYTYTLPADFNEFISVKDIGETFYLDKDNILTEDQLQDYADETDIVGIRLLITDNEFRFVPDYTVTTPVTMKYERLISANLTDVSTDTIFPRIFRNLLITGVRMHYYDYDKDGRYTKEVTLYQDEMYKVKAWDNQLKPKPQFNKHGYLH